MGRWPWSDRRIVEECRLLSVTDMNRAGVFRKGTRFWTSCWENARGEETGAIGYWVRIDDNGEPYLQFDYKITSQDDGQELSLDYRVDLTMTPCNFGGHRYWFLCPLEINGKRCERRVGKLYLPSGERPFGCRRCYNLTYLSRKAWCERDGVIRNIRRS